MIALLHFKKNPYILFIGSMMKKANRKSNPKIEEARNSLIQGAMREIYESLNTSNFYLRVFCLIAKFGLQQEAKKEGLITFDETKLEVS